jgi:hypothetical protein
MRGKNKRYELSCGQWDFTGVHVIVGKDIPALLKWVNNHFKEAGIQFSDHNPAAGGRVWRKEGYWPVLWLPRRPRTSREHGTLAHECFHITYAILSWAGVVLSSESEETFTYLQGHLVTQVLNKCK